jgi:hypothetical protein
MPALNVNKLVVGKKYLIHLIDRSQYHPEGAIKYIGTTSRGNLEFNTEKSGTGSVIFDPSKTKIYNVNATDYPTITHSAPARSSSTAATARPAPVISSSTARPAPASSSSTAATTRPAPTGQWRATGWNEEEDYTRPAPASSSSTAATTRPAPASSSSTSQRPQYRATGWNDNEEEDYTSSAPASSSSTAATATSPAPASSSSTSSPPLSNATKISYMQNHYAWMANDYVEPENQYSAMGHGGKRYTTHKQRKHKSRKSRKGRKSQKRCRS